MLTRNDNELVCRVGPDAPMGKVFRRYWHPVCTSEQLPRPDCDPLRVRLLGEDFVAFRDSAGRVGVFDELCMHRGASLALGRVEEGGLRCLFHGWKFSVDGTVLDTPNQPDPKYRERMKAPAYSVREEGGLVWAYIGPKDRQPEFSRFAFMDAEPQHRVVLRVNVNCNYLQLLEGGEDSSHVGVLHSNMARPGWKEKSFVQNPDVTNPAALAVEDNAPELEIEDTEFGFHYAAFRSLGAGAPEGRRNCRVVPFILPYTRIIPAPAFLFTVFEVPADDTHTHTYIVVHGNAPVTQDKIIQLLGLDDARYFSKETCEFTATWKDRFGQNRQRMSESWTGLVGVEVEDASIALSQGPLYDRSKEHLVPADRAVVRVRRLLLDSVKRVDAGGDPVGVGVDLSRVGACDANVLPTDRWQALMPGHRPLPPKAALRQEATA
ncbi:MAG: Phthalate 4,5-dioxygenase [Rhizobacter sp.]|nr:Phthalate 4,5-dioxygenase [Rhizobacter sp.]